MYKMRTASFGRRFFLSSLYSSPEGKQEIKAPKRWRKAAFGATAVVVLLAAVGAAFSLHHRPKSYEGGAQVVYTDKGKSYKLAVEFFRR